MEGQRLLKQAQVSLGISEPPSAMHFEDWAAVLIARLAVSVEALEKVTFPKLSPNPEDTKVGGTD